MLASLLLGSLLVQTPSSLPPIGLALNVKESAREEDFLDSAREQIRFGLTASTVSYSWNELEPTPGAFDLKKADDSIGIAKFVGGDAYVTIKVLDTTNKILPEDLKGQALNSPEVKERFATLLRNLLSRFNNKVKAISLGNEVDVYLTAHPEEVPAYLDFLAAGRAVLKESAPDMKSGVTTTFEGLQQNRPLIEKLQNGSDVVFMTYYATKPDFSPQPLTEVPKNFSTMLSFAGTRKLALQEIGLPASETLSSSEDIQAKFVTTVFDLLRKHKSQIEMAAYFIQVDFNRDLLDMYAKYYGSDDPRFRAFLGTLGLRKADGTPRKAHAEFKKQLQQG
jgi:hypothetical protein